MVDPILIRQAPLYLGIHVDKPDHRTDALNALDLVADAIQDGLKLDDRWFVLSALTWGVSPGFPMIYAGIGQDESPDVAVCGRCGSLKGLGEFLAKTGAQGVCKPCRTAQRVERKARDREKGGPAGPPPPGMAPPWA